MEGIQPSIFVLTKLSYFADLNKLEYLFGNRIEYALEHLTFNQGVASSISARLTSLPPVARWDAEWFQHFKQTSLRMNNRT